MVYVKHDITYYYYCTHLSASLPGRPELPGSRKVKPVWIYIRQEMMEFWDAVASAGPYCKQYAHGFIQITTPTPHHSIFTGWVLFLTPNQVSKHWRQTQHYIHYNENGMVLPIILQISNEFRYVLKILSSFLLHLLAYSADFNGL